MQRPSPYAACAAKHRPSLGLVQRSSAEQSKANCPARSPVSDSVIVANAIEHGEGTVRLVLRDEGDSVSLDVHNRGKTISADAIPTLFEPFRSGAGSAGWGLGLYIAREIVRAHGGSIRVASASDETVFTMQLPKARRAADAVAPSPAARTCG